MINNDEMMPLLVSSCPSFLPLWETFLSEWEEEACKLHYLALHAFACHLVELLSKGQVEDFVGVFAVVERLHLEGNHYVREAATVGLLESLQNTNIHKFTQPEQFLQYLSPETNRWWNKLNRFWENGGIMFDD